MKPLPLKSVLLSPRSLGRLLVLSLIWVGTIQRTLADPPQLPLWPGTAPGEQQAWPAEADLTSDKDSQVAGRRVIRVGNVSVPTLQVFAADPATSTGAAVLICPGGGHRILAYDLEGTEVAEWLQSRGITAVVLKYRVPARREDQRWEAAVQDAQRAMSVLRSRAESLAIDPQRMGILGFSAGGQTAAFATFAAERHYAPLDAADQHDYRPNFAILIYPAYLVNEERTALVPEAAVNDRTPPLFLVHAYNDPVPVENSVLLFLAAKRANRVAELHAFATGGHGFGLRGTDEPVTRWPELCEQWLQRQGLLGHDK